MSIEADLLTEIINHFVGSNSYNLVKDYLVPRLELASKSFDFYLPTQHQGFVNEYQWPSTVGALNIVQSDSFFEKMPKKYVVVHVHGLLVEGLLISFLVFRFSLDQTSGRHLSVTARNSCCLRDGRVTVHMGL